MLRYLAGPAIIGIVAMFLFFVAWLQENHQRVCDAMFIVIAFILVSVLIDLLILS